MGSRSECAALSQRLAEAFAALEAARSGSSRRTTCTTDDSDFVHVNDGLMFESMHAPEAAVLLDRLSAEAQHGPSSVISAAQEQLSTLQRECWELRRQLEAAQAQNAVLAANSVQQQLLAQQVGFQITILVPTTTLSH